VLTGLASLGLSEIAWSKAKEEPYWIYFMDGMMVYKSPAFNCETDRTCEYRGEGVLP
jgi:hypothetical protein